MSTLIIIRGNSGSVKTSVAKMLHKKIGRNTLLIDGKDTEALPLLITLRLDQKDKDKVVIHLAGCGNCRKEMALLIRLRNVHEGSMKEVPQKVKLSAFDLIPKTNSQYKSLLYLDPLFDALKLVNMMIGFAKQLI